MKKLWIGIAVGVGVVLIGVVFVLMSASELGGEVATITTFDAKGEPHQTRVWVVEHGPEPWLRAGSPESSWLARINAYAEIELERGGSVARYQALTEADPKSVRRINHLMAQKYGLADTLIGLMRDDASVVPIRLRIIEDEAPIETTRPAPEPVAGQAKADPVTVSSDSAVFHGLESLPGGLLPGRALAVSGDGHVVVGSSSSARGIEAFLSTEEGLIGLGDLPGGGFSSQALGVSRDGGVIVGRGLSADGTEAFRWNAGLMTGLGDLPGGSFHSVATGVSADGGVVVGRATSEHGVEAFRLEGGQMVGLGDLPGGSFDSVALAVSSDGDVVVGVSDGRHGREAFRWQGGAMKPLGKLASGPGWSSAALAVSDDGSTAVGEGSAPEGTLAVRWAGDELTSLGGLAAIRADLDSVALAVSGDGSTVVGRSFAVPNGGAFVWDEAQGMRSIQELLANEHGIALEGWSLDAAHGMSDDGRVIVGFGRNPDGVTQPWRVELRAVEPAPAAEAPSTPTS